MQDKIKVINDSSAKAYLAITGGGTPFIGNFMSKGGASNTILGVNVPYSQDAFVDFANYFPAKFTSPEASEALALAAYKKAHRYERKGDIFGLGIAASLAKNGPERKDRRNLAYITIIDNINVWTFSCVFDDHDRENQEKMLSDLILDLLYTKAARISLLLSHPNLEEHTHGYNTVYARNPTIDPVLSLPPGIKYILPGSFNPLHDGHRYIKKFVEDFTGEKVYYELTVNNAEKGLILPSEYHQRRMQFTNDEVIGIEAALFIDKAKFYRHGTTFIVGADTFRRLTNLQYNNETALFNLIMRYGMKFVVLPRDELTADKLILEYYEDHSIHDSWHLSNLINRKLQKHIDQNFKEIKISSTEIRNGQA